jgi:hypothetical protein
MNIRHMTRCEIDVENVDIQCILLFMITIVPLVA